MKFKVLSDLHLEHSNIKIEDTGEDFIILAGDISADKSLLHNFFSYNCPEKPIFYILGNHEYEISTFENRVDELKNELKDYSHIHILQNESAIFNNVKIIGTTLWADVSNMLNSELKDILNSNILQSHRIKTKLNDNYRIWDGFDLQKEFEKSKQFLKYELRDNPFEGYKIAVTHFAPSKKSINPKYKKNALNEFWASDLEHLMGFSKYWIHGHTHDSFNYNIEGTNVICNPRGVSKIYNLSENLKFQNDLLLELEYKKNKLKIK